MKFIAFALLFLVYAASYAKEENLEEFLIHIPEEGKTEFLRYALTQGFSSIERRPMMGPPPKTPHLFADLYAYYLRWRRVEDNSYYRDPYNTICFPSVGCIDISDTGIYP